MQNILIGTAEQTNPVVATSSEHYKIFGPSDPTYWPTSQRKRPDIFAIFVTKIPKNLFHYIENFNDLISDHSSVLLTLNSTLLTRS